MQNRANVVITMEVYWTCTHWTACCNCQISIFPEILSVLYTHASSKNMTVCICKGGESWRGIWCYISFPMALLIDKQIFIIFCCCFEEDYLQKHFFLIIIIIFFCLCRDQATRPDGRVPRSWRGSIRQWRIAWQD